MHSRIYQISSEPIEDLITESRYYDGFVGQHADYVATVEKETDLIEDLKWLGNRNGIEVDLDSKSVMVDGCEVAFTKREFELLKLLIDNPNKVFSREEILKLVWHDDVCVLDRTVDVNITRVRKKIGRYGSNLVSRQGYGYSFKS